ncbi:MAG: stage V sporulation protein AD [Lachnospiraceae bacterium]|nr:stage V sporulation protein AD [Lachnospiraceae bacterium]
MAFMGKYKHIGEQSIRFEQPPYIIGSGCVAGKKEGEGPLGKYFDLIEEDPMCGGKCWEEAEANLQKKAVEIALKKGKIKAEDIEYLIAGDLLDQLVASTFGIMQFQIPLFGVYGACSTMGESLALASILVEGGFAKHAMAVTSSHTASAERQFRFPVSYGNQKPLSATWTVTGSGAIVVGNQKHGSGPYVRVTGVSTGKVVDYGMKDSMNMGACMAPAAAQVIGVHLRDFEARPEDYDKIITGDLGVIGQKILFDLLKQQQFDIEKQHMDCGIEIYERTEQDVHSGGSGCGCAAITLAGYILEQFQKKQWKKVLFVPTGALLSKVSFNEGRTVPGICHAILLERED